MSYEIVKRIIDIIGSILGIVLFSPIMLLTAIWIKIVSPKGPILADMPLRVGRYGKEFKMYKFRSMIPNAHEFMLNNPEMRKLHRENGYKLDPDPRLFPGAKFYRKASIDEMPQVFNVLKGQMSLVGPRAYFAHELKEQEEKYPGTARDIEKLKTVKPGITGPWQVSGRAELSFPKRAQLDGNYAGKKSNFYDLFIILKTPFAVISQRGSF